MDDAHLVLAVAVELVARHGQDALGQIREKLAEARRVRDELSAEAWADIRSAATSLLSIQP
jgi:hypothetical protein